jgi:anti-sigma B factor antagonist
MGGPGLGLSRLRRHAVEYYAHGGIRMEINVKESGKICVINVLVPKIDYTICGAIKARILALVDEKAPQGMLLSLEGVTFIDSMSIGALVSIRKAVIAKGGKFALCNLHPFVNKILSVVTVNAIFDVYDNEEKALKTMQHQFS